MTTDKPPTIGIEGDLVTVRVEWGPGSWAEMRMGVGAAREHARRVLAMAEVLDPGGKVEEAAKRAARAAGATK